MQDQGITTRGNENPEMTGTHGPNLDVMLFPAPGIMDTEPKIAVMAASLQTTIVRVVKLKSIDTCRPNESVPMFRPRMNRIH